MNFKLNVIYKKKKWVMAPKEDLCLNWFPLSLLLPGWGGRRGGLIYGTKEAVGRSKQKSGTRGMNTKLLKLVGTSSLASVPLLAPPVLVSVLVSRHDQKPALLSFLSSQGNNEPST